jgi:hypothetical protein
MQILKLLMYTAIETSIMLNYNIATSTFNDKYSYSLDGERLYSVNSSNKNKEYDI